MQAHNAFRIGADDRAPPSFPGVVTREPAAASVTDSLIKNARRQLSPRSRPSDGTERSSDDIREPRSSSSRSGHDSRAVPAGNPGNRNKADPVAAPTRADAAGDSLDALREGGRNRRRGVALLRTEIRATSRLRASWASTRLGRCSTPARQASEGSNSRGIARPLLLSMAKRSRQSVGGSASSQAGSQCPMIMPSRASFSFDSSKSRALTTSPIEIRPTISAPSSTGMWRKRPSVIFSRT